MESPGTLERRRRGTKRNWIVRGNRLVLAPEEDQTDGKGTGNEPNQGKGAIPKAGARKHASNIFGAEKETIIPQGIGVAGSVQQSDKIVLSESEKTREKTPDADQNQDITVNALEIPPTQDQLSKGNDSSSPSSSSERDHESGSGSGARPPRRWNSRKTTSSMPSLCSYSTVDTADFDFDSMASSAAKIRQATSCAMSLPSLTSCSSAFTMSGSDSLSNQKQSRNPQKVKGIQRTIPAMMESCSSIFVDAKTLQPASELTIMDLSSSSLQTDSNMESQTAAGGGKSSQPLFSQQSVASAAAPSQHRDILPIPAQRCSSPSTDSKLTIRRRAPSLDSEGSLLGQHLIKSPELDKTHHLGTPLSLTGSLVFSDTSSGIDRSTRHSLSHHSRLTAASRHSKKCSNDGPSSCPTSPSNRNRHSRHSRKRNNPIPYDGILLQLVDSLHGTGGVKAGNNFEKLLSRLPANSQYSPSTKSHRSSPSSSRKDRSKRSRKQGSGCDSVLFSAKNDGSSVSTISTTNHIRTAFRHHRSPENSRSKAKSSKEAYPIMLKEEYVIGEFRVSIEHPLVPRLYSQRHSLASSNQFQSTPPQRRRGPGESSSESHSRSSRSRKVHASEQTKPSRNIRSPRCSNRSSKSSGHQRKRSGSVGSTDNRSRRSADRANKSTPKQNSAQRSQSASPQIRRTVKRLGSFGSTGIHSRRSDDASTRTGSSSSQSLRSARNLSWTSLKESAPKLNNTSRDASSEQSEGKSQYPSPVTTIKKLHSSDFREARYSAPPRLGRIRSSRRRHTHVARHFQEERLSKSRTSQEDCREASLTPLEDHSSVASLSIRDLEAREHSFAPRSPILKRVDSRAKTFRRGNRTVDQKLEFAELKQGHRSWTHSPSQRRYRIIGLPPFVEDNEDSSVSSGSTSSELSDFESFQQSLSHGSWTKKSYMSSRFDGGSSNYTLVNAGDVDDDDFPPLTPRHRFPKPSTDKVASRSLSTSITTKSAEKVLEPLQRVDSKFCLSKSDHCGKEEEDPQRSGLKQTGSMEGFATPVHNRDWYKMKPPKALGKSIPPPPPPPLHSTNAKFDDSSFRVQTDEWWLPDSVRQDLSPLTSPRGVDPNEHRLGVLWDKLVGESLREQSKHESI